MFDCLLMLNKMVLKTVFCSTDPSLCLEATKYSESILEGIDIDGKGELAAMHCF